MKNIKQFLILNSVLFINGVLSSQFDLIGNDPRIEIGVSTSAYQIEGAYQTGGKSPSIWDEFTHRNPSPIAGGSNGDVACNSYENFSKDVSLLADLNITHYRFSFSWSRLFPQADDWTPNAEGVQYYHQVLNSLASHNITPWVTLFHWDLPLYLQESYGGWISRRILDDFVKYSDFCFREFGDKVKHWITINEPLTFCQLGYGSGTHAPGIRDNTQQYIVGHHLLLAHAAVFRRYKSEYFKLQKGQISMSLNSDFFYPKTTSPSDLMASDLSLIHRLGWFADPLLTGNYPEVMRLDPSIPLPVFTKEEIRMLYQSLDFFALNHYASFQVSLEPGERNVDKIKIENIPGSVPTASSWLMAYPPGIRSTIEWLYNRHPLKWENITLAVTENGVSTGPNEMNDVVRYTMLPQYYEQLYLARDSTGIQITNYFIWSILDNFEWAAGYTERFGLFYIDFSNEDRARIPKRSVYELFPGFSVRKG